MTDKEIIINGIDVSKCKYFQSSCVPDYSGGYLYKNVCRNHGFYDCDKKPCAFKCIEYRKQLKRKEQECNKLYIQLKADEEYHKEEENTLRKIIKNKEERSIELYKENNKLKQTLIGIKEIAEENIRIADLEGLNGVYRRGLAEQILQKINEVENE